MMVMIKPPVRPSLLGVLYAEDFDDEGELPETDEPAPLQPETIEPLFTFAEVETARAQARQDGRGDAEHGLAASRNHLLGLLAAGVADARTGAHEAASAAAEQVARCMLSALAACLPALCKQHGGAELCALAAALLPALTDEPRVVLRINPEMMPVMEAELHSMDPEIAGHVSLLPSDTVAPGDARLSWTDGSAVRDAARVRAAFEAGLASLGLLEPEQTHA